MSLFHISIRWWSFIGVWVTAKLLKSPGFFLVFLSDLSNVVAWVVSILVLMYSSFCLFFRIIIIVTPWELTHQHYMVIFYWSLSHSKSPQVSRTLLSIRAVLNNVVVWMVSIHPLISKSSSSCTNPLVTVPRTTIIIGINVPFIFHSFFTSIARFKYLSFFSFSFNCTLWSSRTAILQVLFFFLLL